MEYKSVNGIAVCVSLCRSLISRKHLSFEDFLNIMSNGNTWVIFGQRNVSDIFFVRRFCLALNSWLDMILEISESYTTSCHRPVPVSRAQVRSCNVLTRLTSRSRTKYPADKVCHAQSIPCLQINLLSFSSHYTLKYLACVKALKFYVEIGMAAVVHSWSRLPVHQLYPPQ